MLFLWSLLYLDYDCYVRIYKDRYHGYSCCLVVDQKVLLLSKTKTKKRGKSGKGDGEPFCMREKNNFKLRLLDELCTPCPFFTMLRLTIRVKDIYAKTILPGFVMNMIKRIYHNVSISL